jgi:hypothetical protein
MGGRRNGFCRVKDSIDPEALRDRWVVCEVWAKIALSFASLEKEFFIYL